MPSNFASEYQTLGIVPGTPWVEVQLAYRRLRQRFHPDKASAQGRDPETVLARFMAIQRAYDALAGYRREYGHLPEREPPASAADSPGRHDRPGGGTVHEPESLRRRVAIVGAFVALCLIGPAIVVLVPSADFKPAKTRDPAPSMFGRYADAEASGLPHVELDMKATDVLAHLGQPTAVEGNLWRYGDSYVQFSRGRVAGWEVGENTHFTAAVANMPPPDVSEGARLRLGATPAQVSAIQGEPDDRSELEWSYGMSKVYFRDQRVVGWVSSPLEPLLVDRDVVVP